MKLMPTPRRLLQLDALFARRRRPDAARFEPAMSDTRMPDDAEVIAMQRLLVAQRGRIAAEMALADGARRVYATRGETEVIEARRAR